MTLTAGEKLGPYEILALIGKGGMGEVYRARDTRLNRDVAVKFSAERFSERFEREARAIAALNHPNICHLYDVGPDYLVMELIEGESPKGPLPLEEALRIARQIAAALEAAHEKGVVHRDLKPANIKVKSDGTVKVLDFGLAKTSPVAGGVSSENSPTLTMAATQAGVILGTAAYMSPEQARGKPVDKRADIWAFGVVLFELLTGKRLFKGDDLTETLASVVKDRPDLSVVPIEVRRLLGACLEKDPKNRLRDIGDAWRILDERPADLALAAAAAPSSNRGWLGWATAGLFAIATLAISFQHFREAPPVEQHKALFEMPWPSGVARPFSLSPDGRYLAMAGKAQTGRLWVRPIDSSTARELPGSEGANYPFWSPDSTYIGFFADGKLKKIALASGTIDTLCDAAGNAGGSWNSNGVILFPLAAGSSDARVLGRVPENGGIPMAVTKRAALGDVHKYPVFLPDGKHFLYLLTSENTQAAGIYVGSLDGGEPVKLLPDQSSAEYVPAAPPVRNGFVLFARGTTLMALPFDPEKLQAKGQMFPLADQVSFLTNTGHSAFSTSASGILAYLSGASVEARQLVWVDRDGKRQGALPTIGGIFGDSISPDGKTVAMSLIDRQTGTGDFWLVNSASGALSRFSSLESGSLAALPAWSWDGKRIAYAVRPPSSVLGYLYVKAASGAGQPELLLHFTGSDAFPYDWSPDGKFIVYGQTDRGTGRDIWLLPLDGDRKPIPYLNTAANEDLPQFSPVGQWMAYVSDESGKDQVYIQSVPANGRAAPVSVAGGSQPRWRRDGRELFYVSPDQKMMAVPVKISATGIEAGTPHAIFEGAPESTRERIDYQPTDDGQRFLLNLPADVVPTPITMALNWQAGLTK